MDGVSGALFPSPCSARIPAKAVAQPPTRLEPMASEPSRAGAGGVALDKQERLHPFDLYRGVHPCCDSAMRLCGQERYFGSSTIPCSDIPRYLLPSNDEGHPQKIRFSAALPNEFPIAPASLDSSSSV